MRVDLSDGDEAGMGTVGGNWTATVAAPSAAHIEKFRPKKKEHFGQVIAKNNCQTIPSPFSIPFVSHWMC